jgi:hypothetical protein
VVPAHLKESVLAGHRPLDFDPNLAPVCFCNDIDVKCGKHANEHPTVDSLIDLIDD